MSLDFYLCNHRDATFFELGKGSWSSILDGNHVYDSPEAIKSVLKVLKENWPEPDWNNYCLDVAKVLYDFIKDVPAQNLELIHNAGDDHWMVKCLNYKCVGSRFGLGDPEKTKKYIDEKNESETNWVLSDLCQDAVKDLKNRGWNFKNVKPKLRTRFELLKTCM